MMTTLEQQRQIVICAGRDNDTLFWGYLAWSGQTLKSDAVWAVVGEYVIQEEVLRRKAVRGDAVSQ